MAQQTGSVLFVFRYVVVDVAELVWFWFWLLLFLPVAVAE
jgi:hypothetical protein